MNECMYAGPRGKAHIPHANRKVMSLLMYDNVVKLDIS